MSPFVASVFALGTIVGLAALPTASSRSVPANDTEESTTPLQGDDRNITLDTTEAVEDLKNHSHRRARKSDSYPSLSNSNSTYSPVKVQNDIKNMNVSHVVDLTGLQTFEMKEGKYDVRWAPEHKEECNCKKVRITLVDHDLSLLTPTFPPKTTNQQ